MSSLLLACGTLSVLGQAADSPIVFNNTAAITTSFVQAPSLGGTSGGSSNAQWLKIEFRYSVTLPKDNPSNYLDSAEFKVWVEGLDLAAPDAPVPGQGLAVALTGSVKYVNLPVGRDCYGVVFISPDAMGRYSKTLTDFERKFNIHIEAYAGGKLGDLIDKNKEQDPNWFKALKAVPGMVLKQNQTAFIIADPDRYPMIAQPATDSGGAGDSSSSSSSSAPAPGAAPTTAPTQ